MKTLLNEKLSAECAAILMTRTGLLWELCMACLTDVDAEPSTNVAKGDVPRTRTKTKTGPPRRHCLEQYMVALFTASVQPSQLPGRDVLRDQQ